MTFSSRTLRSLIFLLVVLLSFAFALLLPPDREQTLGVWDVVASPTPSSVPIAFNVLSNTPAPPGISEEQYKVVKVIDGDTIVVVGGDLQNTVRLIGINTPESVDPRRPVECYGKEASERAREVLANRNVTLVPDPTQTERDKYNRLLRYVYRDDGLFINKWLIAEGYAYEYTYDTPYEFQEAFRDAQKTAQLQQKGLWGEGACPQSPAQPKTTIVDKDCGDFLTQAEAQTFFLSQGGPDHDPHKLDANNDGAVCESLP